MAANKKKKRRKAFWSNIKFKYRLTITNENTLEDIVTLRVSKLNGISVLLSVLTVLFLIASLIVAFTPLRNYLPGYMNSEIRAQVVENALRVDSLKMFVRMIRPRQVLEIGTYSGYSALCMAEGLPDNGMLHTFEINDEQEDFTRPWLENSPYADKIKFYIGNALELVPRLDITFDLAFIDGDKRRYIDYYEMVLARLSDGGYIIADNTLWDGHVLEEQPHRTDLQTIGIKAFNDLVAADNRVEKVILPLRDGLTIIRKK